MWHKIGRMRKIRFECRRYNDLQRNESKEENLVDVTGFEPATPCLQSRTLKNTKCFVRCRLHVKSSQFSLSQLYRSCTEVEALRTNPKGQPSVLVLGERVSTS